MEDKVGAKLGDIELKVFLGEDCWFALVIDDGHQLGIDLALLAQQQGDQYKEGIHYDAKRFVIMKILYVSLYHPLKRRLTVLRSKKRKIKVLNSLNLTWQQWMHLQQKILARQPE